MNKVLINRFLKETSNRNLNIEEKPIIEIKDDDEPVIEKDNSQIVDPEILRIKLLEKLNPEPKIIMEENENEIPKIELIHFATLEEFASWYEKSKDLFSEKQQKPLNTLVEARNMATGGCNCNLQHRKNMANNYFRDFWIRNQSTDLLPTLQKILQTKKIIFGDFLSFPS